MNKKDFILLLSILVFLLNCKAQDSLEIAKQFGNIIKLIRQDSILELAHLIKFPLKRENPLPDISTANEFILYSPVLLDSVLKNKLKDYNDSDIFMHLLVFLKVIPPFKSPATAVVWCSCRWICSPAITNNVLEEI